ncbi:CBS domain containing-hemolysin-like protein [Lacrimispora xylanisolvens]|uniref:CBS domain containing-hemolysin-like protein n=1 Tax=Lacrimispora xylanisolvens TaxID=384636 RepID=A0A2S6HZI5_9FIRM|nr:hemolysin family protein [Hungatella xylanolytica]PPK83574.1 CBS domain containing-hemolysin-like protein [Hungatella xylanolytica]
MDSSDYIQLLTLVLLVSLSAFFSSAETALTTVNRIRVRTLAEAGNKNAITLTKILENQGKMLSAILVGNNVANLTASSLSTTLVMSIWGNKAVSIGTGILTLVILVFGEISPKTISTLYSETIALRYAKIVYAFMTIMTPVIYVVHILSSSFLRFIHVNPNKKQDSITEDELRTIVDVSHEEGVIESEERKMINNVFDFGDSVARDIMIPRIDMTLVDVNATYEELIDIFREEMYTRIPVYEETNDNVIGIINMKDLLLTDNSTDFNIRNFLREPLYTYEYKKTAELMIEMRQTCNNVVIVLDEYGATAGMITLEDLLEEIVGEIRDEYDEDEENELVEVAPLEYLVEGSMKLDDLNDRLGLELESEDYDSIAGLIIGLLDRLPEQGEEVVCNNIRLVVEALDKNRIDKVRMYLGVEETGQPKRD